MKDIHEVIDELDHMDKCMFNSSIEHALRDAIAYLKEYCPKPPLTACVREIKYFTGADFYGKTKWRFHRHVPTAKYIDDMTIGELCDLVKSGNFDKDMFETCNSMKQFKLPWDIGETILSMLMSNGYLKLEEVPKMRWNK